MRVREREREGREQLTHSQTRAVRVCSNDGEPIAWLIFPTNSESNDSRKVVYHKILQEMKVNTPQL